jgi:hypothetical protein
MKRGSLVLAVLAALLVLSALALVAPTRAAPGRAASPTVYSKDYTLGAWPNVAGPFAGAAAPACTRDSTGVCVFVVNGIKYNHPVEQAWDGLVALAKYQAIGPTDIADLALAEKEAARLVGTHLTSSATGASWWLPYRFNFAEYGLSADTLHAPWYSGMAQGEVLELFSRLYLVTKASQYRTDAIDTFDSFIEPLQAGQAWNAHPWVDLVDSTSHFWIEEYASSRTSDDVINGSGFAVFGLIDYFKIVQDSRAHPLINEGLLTFLYGADHARNPGGVASYSLSLRSDRSAQYHLIVTAQLQDLATLTTDTFYKNEAAGYLGDYHLTATSATPTPPGFGGM